MPKTKAKTKAGKLRKVAAVMREAKAGRLHSGSPKGPIVTNPKQKIAIALSEAKLSKPPGKRKRKPKRAKRRG